MHMYQEQGCLNLIRNPTLVLGTEGLDVLRCGVLFGHSGVSALSGIMASRLVLWCTATVILSELPPRVRS